MKRKHVLSIGVVALLVFLIAFLERQATPKPAHLELLNDTFDFGTVHEGGVYEHIFQFSNSGSGRLNILHIQGTCGCTIATVSLTSIQPGEKADLSVSLNTRGLFGRTEKKVFVASNDRSHPTTVVTIRATVIPALNMLQHYVPREFEMPPPCGASATGTHGECSGS